MYVFTNLIFAITHYRLFHHPLFYKRFHKTHHEWTAPVGVVSVYAHPLEHIVSNSLPLIIGPIIVKSHLSLTWFWYFVAILNTVNSHSGYHMPFMLSSEGHDFHHLKYAVVCLENLAKNLISHFTAMIAK